jgi:uncharacterized protein YdaU (DUF1376 family)
MANKNTYYFSHDYNAHNDVKILFMRQQLGMEGYGIYWFLVESLANAGGYLPMNMIPILTMQMHSTEAKVSGVIREFDLFKIVDEQFFSIRLNEHLQDIKMLKQSKSEAGKRSAEVRKLRMLNSTSVEHVLNTSPTGVEHDDNICSTKERKGKERKKEKNKKESFTEIFSSEKIVGTKENILKLYPKGHPKLGESAIAFSEDRKYAIFEDGYMQEIGGDQLFHEQPNLIKRGHIY